MGFQDTDALEDGKGSKNLPLPDSKQQLLLHQMKAEEVVKSYSSAIVEMLILSHTRIALWGQGVSFTVAILSHD